MGLFCGRGRLAFAEARPAPAIFHFVENADGEAVRLSFGKRRGGSGFVRG